MTKTHNHKPEYQSSAQDDASTLLPMLIGGLIMILIGMVVVIFFV